MPAPSPTAPGDCGAEDASGPQRIRKGRYEYQRRRPEQSALYRIVQDNLETLYAAVEAGFASAPLPKFVRDEFERFLDCGLLCRGAALMVCDSEGCCGIQVVALSCRGRGFCPSCLGRKMAQTSANLVERVFPVDVPLRQWVVTFPFELRARLGFDAPLLSAVSGVVVDTLLAFYERRMRDHLGPLPPVPITSSDDDHERDGSSATRRPKLQSGTVTVVQRTNSDFRLNPHLHVLALDGVFVEPPDGSRPRFESLPHLTSIEVAEVVTVLRTRVLGLLLQRGVLDDCTDQLVLSAGELADDDAVLAQLTSAATSGLPPAGPERREREPLRLTRTPGASISGALCAADMGFTLHAATLAKRNDLAGKEALARYVLRPPLAQDRITLLPDGRVRLALKRPFSDGTVAVEMDGLSLLCRLAASIPGPRFHTVRYGGVLSAAATWRPLVVPDAPDPPGDEADAETAATHGGASAPGQPPAAQPDAKPKPRSTWRPWRELLKRSFDIDRLCPHCGGPLRLKAFLVRPQSLERLLTTLGETTEPPQRAPPRRPPYFRSRPVRRQPPPAHGSQGQAELFDPSA